VLSDLKANLNPLACVPRAVYAAVSGSTPTTHGPASFDDWFAAHPGRQAPFSQPVAFDQSTGAYSFALPSFWPIDGVIIAQSAHNSKGVTGMETYGSSSEHKYVLREVTRRLGRSPAAHLILAEPRLVTGPEHACWHLNQQHVSSCLPGRATRGRLALSASETVIGTLRCT